MEWFSFYWKINLVLLKLTYFKKLASTDKKKKKHNSAEFEGIW